jgi:hypothetical protein
MGGLQSQSKRGEEEKKIPASAVIRKPDSSPYFIDYTD